MRPTRLELSGFASFREATVVDFEGVDLFVLAGPTGAGKSSIIDAITFALYGSVSRYDDRRLVAPVISQGQLEARVRLDFTVDGDAYTAVRVVRRTKTGATTKEARLERMVPTADGPVARTLAGSADELTAAVERLLGLTFEHFTRCVVLPQGDFQQFLHAKPKERQDLLVELLDLAIYRRIGSSAREREKLLAGQADVLQRRLEGELAGATDEARDAATARVAQLETLWDAIQAAQPELDRIKEEGATLRQSAEDHRARVALVGGLAVPDTVAELSERIASASALLADAEQAATAATKERDATDDVLAALPDAGRLREAVRLLREHDTLAAEQTSHAALLTTTRTAAERAASRLEQATTDRAAAETHLEEVRRHDLARALSSGLHAGDPCPVCDRPLESDPADGDADLAAAQKLLRDLAAAEQAAATELARARADLAAAERDHERLGQRANATATSLTEVAAELGDGVDLAGDPEGLTATATEVSQARERAAAAATAEKRARAALEQARNASSRLDAERQTAWTAFDTTRDRLAPLGPPSADRTELAAAWETLVTWGRALEPDLRAAAEAAETAVAAARLRYRAVMDDLTAACRAAEVDTSGSDPRDATSAALERERGRLARVAQAIETAAQVRTERKEAVEASRVAKELGAHLGARRFETWLLNRALRRLVVGASGILRELTTGGYSLDLDDTNAFLVIDHRNADDRRAARTLSGGETFLASLALALALAEHVAELSAHGTARLESLFLDEGFGTLDADTLDTVAAAIHELGARGRMVGLITHVRDLAEQIEVRYEVRKTATTSSVQKVVA